MQKKNRVWKHELTGQTFGGLTVVSKNGLTRSKKRLWKCFCICGSNKEVNVTTQHLLAGLRVSCGCRKLDKSLYHKKIEDVCARHVMRTYANDARMKKRNFSLTEEDVKTFIFSNCAYCNSPPSNTFDSKRSCSRALFEKECKYNGMDRIDSLLGYEKSNVAPCCHRCNKAKSNYDLESFKQWIKQIHDFLLKKELDKSENP